jgi:pimeloyl-ACP methyl ester carboxylesterase
MIRVPLPDGWLSASVRGHGPPILLIRPLGGSIVLWGGFADRLAEDHRVIAFDARGVGQSSRAIPTTTRAMARDARAVLDHLRIERAHVFGISLGGMIATWLAAEYPERVDRLILASTMPWSPSARRASSSFALALAGCFTRPGAACGACVVRRILSPEFRAAHPTEVRRLQRIMRRERFSRHSFLMHLGAAAQHDGRGALERIVAPSLVLIGERDQLAKPESQEWLANALHARVETIDAGHDLTLEKPRETADRVRAFTSPS